MLGASYLIIIAGGIGLTSPELEHRCATVSDSHRLHCTTKLLQ